MIRVIISAEPHGLECVSFEFESLEDKEAQDLIKISLNHDKSIEIFRIEE